MTAAVPSAGGALRPRIASLARNIGLKGVERIPLSQTNYLRRKPDIECRRIAECRFPHAALDRTASDTPNATGGFRRIVSGGTFEYPRDTRFSPL